MVFSTSPESNRQYRDQRLTTGLLLSKLFSGEENMGLLLVLPTWRERTKKKIKKNGVSGNIHLFTENPSIPTEAY